MARVKAEREGQHNNQLHWRYIPLYPLLRIGVARRVTTCRIAWHPPRKTRYPIWASRAFLSLRPSLALAKVVEEHADIRVASRGPVKHDIGRPRSRRQRVLYVCVYVIIEKILTVNN
jgi:hypothetical protein